MGKKAPESNQKKRATRKDKNRAILVSYLSNPENDWPSRMEYSTRILKYKDPSQVYQTLTPDELDEVDAEAMENRKKRSAKQRSILYRALYDEGRSGNVQAIKEFLERTEGKVKEVKDINMTGELSVNVNVIGVKP